MKIFKKVTLIPLLLIIAGIGALVIYLIKTVKSKPINLDASAKKALTSLGITTLDNQRRLGKIAMDLAVNLGTAYPLWDPRSWTEDDKQVFDILAAITQKDFEVVSRVYFDVYAKGRTLTADLAKYLDDKYYSQLNFK